MKEKILAIVLLIFVISAVTVNTVFLLRQIDDTIEDVKSIEIYKTKTKDEAEDIFVEFMKKEILFSLTVSHDDLTEIENCFVELIGYLSVEDNENAEVVKYRLLHSLEHFRRLSGFNIDAII